MTPLSLGIRHLIEALADDPVIEVVKVQPPDGATVRTIDGQFYTIVMYEQPSFSSKKETA
jgi:hypothetical protein